MARMTPDLAKKFLGLQKNGKLSKCPDMPNCVCTCYPDDTKHAMPPIPFTDSVEQAKARLQKVLNSKKGFHIVEEKGDYLRVEVVSSMFKFIDDLEFVFMPKEKVIHFRSASRLGYWDVGANKSRIHKLVAAYQQV